MKYTLKKITEKVEYECSRCKKRMFTDSQKHVDGTLWKAAVQYTPNEIEHECECEKKPAFHDHWHVKKAESFLRGYNIESPRMAVGFARLLAEYEADGWDAGARHGVHVIRGDVHPLVYDSLPSILAQNPLRKGSEEAKK
jgi:hypothetical protein